MNTAEQELAHLRAEVDRLQAELSRSITALAGCIGDRDRLRAMLRYVAYERLPLGDTVIEHLSEERQREVLELLGDIEAALKGTK